MNDLTVGARLASPRVETRRLYEQIADRIRALIDAEGLLEGARLPGERNLASQLGVSRPSLREALIALEVEGRIEIRSGSGVYVCPSGRRGDSSALGLGDSPGELLQARAVLESAVITLAAARVSTLGLLRVEEALGEMRDELARGCMPVEADRRFHLSIAEQSGNSVLVGMVGALFDDRHSPISSRMSMRAETMDSWQAALEEHEAILRVLKSRNPQAAAAQMCHHLQSSHKRWVGEPIEPSKIGADSCGMTAIFSLVDSASNQARFGFRAEPAV
ncbi:FadR/GntR family transcriptional regulator [Roseateles sp. LYH14W]|uniref:FadR/GntR family transcriptional regulator n=1 Tax=Pelomonas parva TaxID=3299032 RepID=A0ABW7FCG4_9BURK